METSHRKQARDRRRIGNQGRTHSQDEVNCKKYMEGALAKHRHETKRQETIMEDFW